MVFVHIEHLNVVMGPHDASDHRLHVPAHPAARAVDLDLLPLSLYRDALDEPSAPGVGRRLPHGVVEKGIKFDASSLGPSRLCGLAALGGDDAGHAASVVTPGRVKKACARGGHVGGQWSCCVKKGRRPPTPDDGGQFRIATASG
jgi:hypothetical protein